MAAELSQQGTIARGPKLAVRQVVKPIILLGSGRSGTSMLGRIIKLHPDVAFWPEPRPIWMYRNAYRPHHELRAEDLTPAIAHYIDRRFARFMASHGCTRFAEKTPTNCLRIPFIHALYPDCKIVNMVRDGREVVGAMFRIQGRKPRPQRLKARIRETPLWEWPAYFPLFFRTMWRTVVLKRRASYWGVKPEGWQAWLNLPPHILAARQWGRAVEISIRDGRALPSENYLELRYETLIREPVQVVAQIAEFAELSHCQAIIDYTVGHVDPTRSGRAKANLSDQQMHEVVDEISDVLGKLGYLEGHA